MDKILFKQFHIGMPVTPYKPEETISSVCKAHNTPVQAALDALNKEFSEKNISIITCEKLKEKMDSGEKPVLLDIRESWERDISKIEGSHIINAENNEIIVGSKDNLAKRKIKLKNVNIITNNKKDFEKELFVKVRSTGKLLRAKISLNSSEAKVDLLEDEYGISPGQACVFYFKNSKGYKVLGGGWIKN